METGDVKIEVDKSLITSILQEKIRIALVEGIGGTGELAQNMIDTYMNEKCDKDGRISDYSSDNKYRRIDWLVKKIIEDAVKKAVSDWATSNEKMLAEQVAKYFKTKFATNLLVKSIGESIIRGLKNDWTFKVIVEPPK